MTFGNAPVPGATPPPGLVARMPAGPAKLAIETGAALLPAHVYYRGEDCVVDLFPPLDCSSGDVGVLCSFGAGYSIGSLVIVRV